MFADLVARCRETFQRRLDRVIEAMDQVFGMFSVPRSHLAVAPQDLLVWADQEKGRAHLVAGVKAA